MRLKFFSMLTLALRIEAPLGSWADPQSWKKIFQSEGYKCREEQRGFITAVLRKPKGKTNYDKELSRYIFYPKP